MGDNNIKRANASEMLAFGGAQFSTSIFMAFLSYYLLMFLTDVVMIPPAYAAVLLLIFRIISAVDAQFVGIFINRMKFKDGKYRPYFKWCTLPFSLSMAAIGVTTKINTGFRLPYVAAMLIFCELSWTVLNTASISLLPYLAQDDFSRSRFMSFSNSSAILAYIAIGTFMLPLAGFLGSGNMEKGFALTLVLFAIITIPLLFNAYFRLNERHYSESRGKPSLKDIFVAIGRNKRVILFMTGFCIYSIADSFKNSATYHFLSHVLKRGDLLPIFIFFGLITPLAVQTIIPSLLKYAKKESLIVFGLFATACVCLLMLFIGDRPVALVVCVVLYGVFTAIVANLVYTVVASLSDELRAQEGLSMSEILSSTMNLSSNLGAAIAGGSSAFVMGISGYSPMVSVQTPGAIFSLRALYTLCPAVCMAIAGFVMIGLKRSGTET
ncbi:MAG: MFS transporter [Oscillospiraceae bacterium]|nr:MFS transporter [Oscillospiraceae bacterium]